MGIKIRAWDRENNVMVYSDNNYPLSKYSIGFDFFNKNKLTLNILVDANSGDMGKVDAVFMRNIGFTDVNNRDIYEFDIVRVFNVSNGNKFSGYIDLRCGVFCIVEDDGTEHIDWGSYEVEVVSNIYV